MNNNLPTIKKEGIFYKIKQYLKKIFVKDKMIDEQKDKTIDETIEETDKKEELTQRSVFIDSLKVVNKDEILMLQRKLKNKELEIEDLTNNQVYDMLDLYMKQIEEIKL